MSDPVRQWTLLLVLTAFLLSVLVLGQIATRYASAYLSAPSEVSAFLDALDSSVEENESYDHHLARVPRLEDKLRLGRLLRDIQKAGDDLREDLNGLLVGGDLEGSSSSSSGGGGSGSGSGNSSRTGGGVGGGGEDGKEGGHLGLGLGIDDHHHVAVSTTSSTLMSSPRLRSPARLLWAARRAELSERVRRLDLLRMRFLVVYMSIVAATTTAAVEKAEKSALGGANRDCLERLGGGGGGSGALVSQDGFGPFGQGRQPTTPHYPTTTMATMGRSPPTPSPSPLGAGVGGLALAADGTRRKPPLRRLTTQAMGHHDGTADDAGGPPGRGLHRLGWAGVVQELQMSPRMHKRHASIENSMARSMTG